MKQSASPARGLFLAAILVLHVIVATDAAVANKCVLGCLRSAFTCFRNDNLGIRTTSVPCCDVYRDCYHQCLPDVLEDPSCNQPKVGKRGSWNKRGVGANEGPSWANIY